MKKTIMSYDTAVQIRLYMEEVITQGTGTAAHTSCAAVYGKTGTAENETEKNHAWFVGFAEGENKESIAFAVLCAYAGRSGGDLCAPMARELINTWFAE